MIGRLLAAAATATLVTVAYWLVAAQARGTPVWQVVALPAAGIGAATLWIVGRRIQVQSTIFILCFALLQPVAGEFARLRQSWLDRLARVEGAAGVQREAVRAAWDELPSELRSNAVPLLLSEAIAVLAAIQAIRMTARSNEAEQASPTPTT